MLKKPTLTTTAGAPLADKSKLDYGGTTRTGPASKHFRFMFM
jgi:hypothetical protein